MSFVPQRYLDSTLAIGQRRPNSKIHWMGTGFLLGRLIAPGQNLYDALLVTNRHVLEGEKTVVIRFNLIKPRESIDFELTLVSAEKTSVVTFHSDSEIDVAVVKLNDSILQTSGVHIQAFISNQDVYPLRLAEGMERELREGGSIFVLGYPMGLVAEKRSLRFAEPDVLPEFEIFMPSKLRISLSMREFFQAIAEGRSSLRGGHSHC